MSEVEVISGGTDGRYTVSLDWGVERKAELIADLADKLAKLEEKIDAQQTLVNAANAAEQAAALNLVNLINNFATSQDGMSPEEQAAASAEFQQVYDFYLKDLLQLRATNSPTHAALQMLKDDKTSTTARRAVWERFEATEEREAWCCDYTEDASGVVGGVQIPGESDTILLAPGGRAPIPATDGAMSARELMSPEQAYFNAAILPGWQKFKPTYRWGTLTAINEDANTGDVSLFAATSSARNLPINAESSLSNVPFNYMECDCMAFDVGRNVVVHFIGQDQASPEIIGFLDTPRPCPPLFIGNIAYPPGEGIIPDKGYKAGRAVDEDYSGYWIRGWDPLEYLDIGAVWPPGLAMNSETGHLQGIPHSPPGGVAIYEGIKLRCNDRGDKYDDSNPFRVTITPGYIEEVELPPIDLTLDSIADGVFSVPDYPYVIYAMISSNGFNVQPDGVVLPPGFYIQQKQALAHISVDSGLSAEYKYTPWFLGPLTATPYPNHWVRVTNAGGGQHWMGTYAEDNANAEWHATTDPAAFGVHIPGATNPAGHPDQFLLVADPAFLTELPDSNVWYAGEDTLQHIAYWMHGGVDEDGATYALWRRPGTIKIEVASDSAGSNIVSTIIGTFDLGRHY